MDRVALLSVHTCPLGELGTRDTGGMNVYVRELSRELGRQGINVDVFTRYRGCNHPCEVELGGGARLVHLGAGEDLEMSKYDLYQYLPEFAGNVVHYAQSNNLSYELIHSHYWLSGWVGEILKACWAVSHLVTFHTLGRMKNMTPGIDREPVLRLSTEDRLISGADRVLALASSEQAQLANLYGIDPNRVAVIPGGVDTRIFRPLDRVEARKRLGIPNGKRQALYVGRLEPLKGVDMLLKAMSLLGDSGAHCLIVGGDASEDGELSRLQALAAELGVSDGVSFAGPVEHELLPWYYSAADVSVVPSRYESFGLVALESIACGTPVVASAVGGLPSIVRPGENGLLSSPTPEGLAESLRLSLNDQSLRESLSARAVDSARSFAWPLVAAQVVELYHSMERVASAA